MSDELTEEAARAGMQRIDSLHHVAWAATDGSQWAVIVDGDGSDESAWLFSQGDVDQFVEEHRDAARPD